MSQSSFRRAVSRVGWRPRGTVPAPDVCLLSMHYPPEATGNAPYSGGLAAGLAASGRRVVAHVAHPHYPEWRIHEGYGDWTTTESLNGVEVRRRRHYVPQPPRGLRRLLSEVSFGLRLAIAPWGSPRVVIALSPALFSTAIAVLRIRLNRRRPGLIVWMQDIYTLGLAETGQGGGTVQRVTRWIERRTLRSADKVVVIHERFAEFVVEELDVPADRVQVIRNWTHLPPSELIDSRSARRELGWPIEGALAVHTGNMGAKQGLENVVDAARLADALNVQLHFILVGDGSEREALRQRASGIRRLMFVDPLCDHDFRLALGAADVLIVNEKPGVSAMAMPSKLTSYFDARRPIVAATDLNGVTASELASADAGVVVPAGNPRALLDAIFKLNENPDDAQRFALNGRRHRETTLDQGQALRTWSALIDRIDVHPAKR